jgi:rhodanese-related sulfurtransferase
MKGIAMDVNPIELTPWQVFDRMTSAQIVDVREADELPDGMVPGARHIPLGQVPARHDLLEVGRPVIAVCHSGRRSAGAAAHLASAGFTAYTMTGGMLAWKTAGLPLA